MTGSQMTGSRTMHYLVLTGHAPGIYDQIDECIEQIKNYPGGELKVFAHYKDAISEQNKVAIQKAQKKHHPHRLKAASESEILAMPEQLKIYVSGRWAKDISNSAIDSHIGAGLIIFKNQIGAPEELPVQVEYGLYQTNGTRHFSEIRALCRALKVAKLIIDNNDKIDGIAIIDGSFYSVNCVTKWASEWEKNKWKNSEKKTIPNLKEVRYAYNLYQKLKQQGVKIVYTNKKERVQGIEAATCLSSGAIMKKQVKMIQHGKTTN